MNLNALSPYIRIAWRSTLRPGYHIRRRVIFDYELILVCGGGCDIEIDGQIYRVKENDAVFLRPGVPHEFIGLADCPFVQPHIHFDPVYDAYSSRRPLGFKDFPDMEAEDYAFLQEDILKDADIPYVFVPKDLPAFQNCFFNAIDIFRKKEKNYLVRYKIEMLCLLDMIFKQFDCYSADTDGEAVSVVSSVKRYIDGNHCEILTLETLSQQFFINKYTLMRSFRKQYGVGVIAYYHQKRIETAKALLRKTALSVSEIAEELNFTDIYTFSRFFKKAVKVSPLAYRKGQA